MNEYKKLRNLVISTIRNSQRSYYKKTITANKSCDIWRAVNTLRPLEINCVVNLVKMMKMMKLPSETNVDILGYDSCILKLSSEIICSSLTILFNMSLCNGEIPNDQFLDLGIFQNYLKN